VGPTGPDFPIAQAGTGRCAGVWGPLSVSEKEGKIPKNGKTSFDQPKVFLDFAYLNNLGTEFDKTLIGRNVLNLLLYNFLIIFHTMLYSKIWFKFEFNLLTKV